MSRFLAVIPESIQLVDTPVCELLAKKRPEVSGRTLEVGPTREGMKVPSKGSSSSFAR